MLIVKLTFLVIIANGAPIIARQLFGHRFAYPVDAGYQFIDGEPLLGRSKTLRGIAASIIATTGFALLIGFDWKIGLLIGSAAMLGDLFTSFIKRRLKKPVSSRAMGLDQIPESLLPMLACKDLLSLTFLDISAVVGLFFVSELLLSQILYRLHIRVRPY
jgi:CDP-2,3-bis-(O-geranylgeranyl)-sn-glycerol synthase